MTDLDSGSCQIQQNHQNSWEANDWTKVVTVASAERPSSCLTVSSWTVLDVPFFARLDLNPLHGAQTVATPPGWHRAAVDRVKPNQPVFVSNNNGGNFAILYHDYRLSFPSLHYFVSIVLVGVQNLSKNFRAQDFSLTVL